MADVNSRLHANLKLSGHNLADREGIEPSPRGLESLVLPLHQRPKLGAPSFAFRLPKEAKARGLYQVVTWLLRFGYTHDAALVT